MTVPEKNTGQTAKFENPLIPHARLRQIYLLMRQARMLGSSLPPAQRNLARGLEACLVSTAVDLGPGDLLSDSVSGGVVDFLRGTPLPAVFGGKARRGAYAAGCGMALRLPSPNPIAGRLWAALGAASALKAIATHAKAHPAPGAEAEGTQTKQHPGVVLACVRPGEAPPAVWRAVLKSAAALELPVVFVVLPPGAKHTAKAGGAGALSLACGVPAIAVDRDDAVAIYRVAQESIGRARAGGGAALIECVPFVLHGTRGKATRPADAIDTMERYLLGRGVASRAWIEREAKAFARKLAASHA
jgi:TPP-dependent pyruvate/acetoin dehydrogenase alpha subunit